MSMTETEGVLMLDSYKAVTIGDKAGKAAMSIMARRTLADISNLPQKPKPLVQDEKRKSIQITTKEYIEKLQKENTTLVKMLAQRHKIIEQSGIELDRLRINLIKAREQNHQLALSHTQMLAELNSGKDRLKALQHELGCKNGLLKARKLDVEKASMRPCQHADVEVNLIKVPEEGEFTKEVSDDEKPRKTKRRLRSQSLGSSQPSPSEENAGNKRPTRRQSARFKTGDASKCPLSDEPLQAEGNAAKRRPCMRRQSAEFKAVEPSYEPVLENGSNSVNGSVKTEDNGSNSGLGSKSQEFGRSSLCRPSRAAAKKVQSYREIPVNVKMRRPA